MSSSSSSMEKGSSASDSDFDSGIDGTDGDALFSAVSAPTGPRASAAKTSDGTNGGAWFSAPSAPTGPRASAAKTSAANPGTPSAMNLRSAPSSHPQAALPATRAAVNVRPAPSSHPQDATVVQHAGVSRSTRRKHNRDVGSMRQSDLLRRANKISKQIGKRKKNKKKGGKK